MSEGLLVLACIALLLAAAGLLLWQWAAGRQARRATGEYLARQIQGGPVHREPAAETRRAATAAPAEAAAPAPAVGLVDPWHDAELAAAASQRRDRRTLALPGWLLGAVTPRMLALGVLSILVLSGLAFLFAGSVAAVAALVVATLLAIFALWLRVQKARKRLVSQLPGFIDAMVRLITVGNSMHAAFQLSIASTQAPLRDHLEKASSLVRAGVDLDQALQQTARSVRVDEMHLLASILGLGVRYGGRADLLLERVAHFMRDQQQAEEELVALSAETRLSAWILGLLPVVVGGFIMMTNAGYFTRMLSDPTGQTLLMIGFGLQALGVLLLYRLARLA